MSNQPPYPGSPDQGPEEPPTRHKGGDPQQANPYGPPQGPPPQGPPPQGPQGPPQQNPYGQPPQPGPYSPPPGQAPYYPPQQGQPQQYPYGQPPQPGPYGQPPWQGHQAPQQGYGPGGQPWQQGPYGPGGPGEPKRSRKKWLLPLIAVVAILVIVGGIFGVMALTGGDTSSGTAVDDLEQGDCLVSSDISDASDSIGDIETVDCGDEHDAEVFATFEVGSSEADGFDLDAAGSKCVDELSGAGSSLEDLEADGNEVRPLVGSAEPAEGDQVVCFIRNSDGDQLSETIVD
jgi:hypothetical protein